MDYGWSTKFKKPCNVALRETDTLPQIRRDKIEARRIAKKAGQTETKRDNELQQPGDPNTIQIQDDCTDLDLFEEFEDY